MRRVLKSWIESQNDNAQIYNAECKTYQMAKNLLVYIRAPTVKISTT